ncbi:MAG: histone deacetylase [Bacteroidota bacterium]
MTSIAIVSSDRFLEHKTPRGHPEQGERLAHLLRHLRKSGLWDSLTHIAPEPASVEDLLRVHAAGLVERVRSVCGQGGGQLDEGDTFASRESYDVALLAAGAVCGGIDAVIGHKADAVFCAVRPPGHHAERDRSMGFCLFNNAAVGARYAQAKHGIERVAILDWDVHHGNGTQHIFEEDPSVLYVSLHQYPYYPGTGAREERGIGAGEGYTMNFPMAAGTGEDAYLAAFHDEIVPALQRFAPGLLIISAGFDAHRDDPLADIRLTEQSYGKFTRLIKDLAPTVSVMEGGYNLEATARSVEEHIRAFG